MNTYINIYIHTNITTVYIYILCMDLLCMMRIYPFMCVPPVFKNTLVMTVVTQFDGAKVELLHERGSSTIDEPKWNIQKAQWVIG